MNYSVPELLMISLLGILIVFIVLLVLSFLTSIMGRIVPALVKGTKPNSKGQSVQPLVIHEQKTTEDDTGELLAVMQSVLSEESGIPADSLIIKSVISYDDADASSPKISRQL